ncbi:hypothetical protein N9K16_03730 [Alphaproteobacteria bacterium]|nr:hypothetical protein [Alphaproteobacteria bacterium]
MARKPVKRNGFARALLDPRYRKRVIKSKKTYTRKGRVQNRPFSFAA